jgi:uroporphyrinogen III methyltransferase/synthase
MKEELAPERPTFGKVSLVGAGPGDPGLITVRGLQRLRQADVVVYDRLVDDQLLAEVRPDAELIYVGKVASRHTLRQNEINALLVSKAREGKYVVRLKGGDPFVFGRGAEEAQDLVDAGIPFEIVPGVSSAVAVPAYAGIPVTHRHYTSSFAVITGHEDPTKPVSQIDWSKLATAVGTIVCLMSVENLSHITAQLIHHGRSPDTPVALIRWGTFPGQETLVGTLADIAELAVAHDFGPPAVAVVGEVVNLHHSLRWLDNLPLFEKTAAAEFALSLTR